MRLRVVFIGLVACLLAGSAPARAWPAETAWPLRAETSVLMSYGAQYAVTGGAVRTHKGVDLAARPGEEVLAVQSGKVAFAGRVPAGEGISTLAVSIDAADGLRYTVMPLEHTSCRTGEDIDMGTVIGALASAGDVSTGEPHLHVSVRRGETYLDPSAFLVPPVGAEQVQGSGAKELVPAESPDPVAEVPALAPAPADVEPGLAPWAAAPVSALVVDPVGDALPGANAVTVPGPEARADARARQMEARFGPRPNAGSTKTVEEQGGRRFAQDIGVRSFLVRSGALPWVTLATGCVAFLLLWPLWRGTAFAPPLRPGLVKLRLR